MVEEKVPAITPEPIKPKTPVVVPEPVKQMAPVVVAEPIAPVTLTKTRKPAKGKKAAKKPPAP